MQSMIRQLLEHPTLGPMVAHRRRIEGSAATYADPARPLPEVLREALASQGIDRLFRHQARGLDLARAGRDVVPVPLYGGSDDVRRTADRSSQVV